MIYLLVLTLWRRTPQIRDLVHGSEFRTPKEELGGSKIEDKSELFGFLLGFPEGFGFASADRDGRELL